MNPRKKSPAGILLVDEHPILRKGLSLLLNQESDLRVCGYADSAASALKAIAAHMPDLVILDIALKGMNGIELIKQAQALYPALPVLVLSQHDEALFAERALRAGAKGYVMKQAPAEDVMAAIRRLIQGARYLSSKMHERVLENLSGATPNGSVSAMERLSDRELEVFHLIGSGYGTRQIAEQLHLSIKTIETYRAHLKEKLKLRTGLELVRIAVKANSDGARV